MTWKVGPALACGSTVVVNPSEETPTTAALLGEVMNAAGVPRGIYNVVHGAVESTIGVQRETIRIVLREVPAEHWAVGGVPKG